MLRLKALGLNGVDLPLPVWTDDHASFLNWALCPDGEVPEVCQTFSPNRSNQEHSTSFYDHWNSGGDERFQVLLWGTSTPTGYALGWGIDRIFIHASHPYGPHVVISSWKDNQWYTCSGPITREIPNTLLQLLGMNVEKEYKGAFFDPNRADTMIFDDAPWSNQRLFSYAGVVYRMPENTLKPRRINGGVSKEQLPAFYKWLSHRLREMARKIVEFRAVWLAGRIDSQRRHMSPLQFFSLWKTVQSNPSLQQTPLILMAYAAHSDRLPGMVPQHFFDHQRFNCFRDGPAWAELSAHIKWGKKDTRDVLYDSTPIKNHSREASRRLSLSESFRWVSALVQTKNPNHLGFETPPQALLEMLLIHARRIPKKSTLASMLLSQFPFWAWLEFHTSWSNEKNTEAWPNIQEMKIDCSDSYKEFLSALETIRSYQKEKPSHFHTMAMAALAWIKSSETENGLPDQQPNAILQQLWRMSIPEPTRKERINKRLTWQGVLSLKRSVEAVKLSPTKDFTQPTPAQGLADLGWPTAIGNLRLGGIDVHPLCRPSHLDLMGEFLQNCVQKSQHLKGFIHVAYQGQSRFFRLSDGHREFLLQISNAGNQTWKVAQLKGRENHDPTPEASAVGQRVAELYTLLSAESPTLPLPSPPNPWEASTDARNARALAEFDEAARQTQSFCPGTNDQDDVVNIIQEILEEMDDRDRMNDSREY